MDGILSDPKKWNEAVQSSVQENFLGEESAHQEPSPTLVEQDIMLQFGGVVSPHLL